MFVLIGNIILSTVVLVENCSNRAFSHLTGLHNAYIIRELLLAIHVSFGIGKHDPGFYRAASIRSVSNAGIPQSFRVHGPDDHVSEPRSARGQEI